MAVEGVTEGAASGARTLGAAVVPLLALAVFINYVDRGNLATAAPLVDLAVVWSLISASMDHFFHPAEWGSDNLVQALLYWAVFIFVDLSAAALGMALEKRAPWSDLPWIPVQRFGYRQLMYYVVVKAVITAVRGPRVGWGKLERRATAAVSARA